MPVKARGSGHSWQRVSGSWVKRVNKICMGHVGHESWVSACDPLTYDPLTDDQVNEIKRTILFQ